MKLDQVNLFWLIKMEFLILIKGIFLGFVVIIKDEDQKDLKNKKISE